MSIASKPNGIMPRVVNRATFVVAIALSGIGSQVFAQTSPEDYKDTTITMVIGYGPGTAYDTYARLLVRHLGRHIPGKPSILPKNMPGAGSTIAANHLYSAAPKDGTVIGSLATSAVLGPLFGLPGGHLVPPGSTGSATWIRVLEHARSGIHRVSVRSTTSLHGKHCLVVAVRAP